MKGIVEVSILQFSLIYLLLIIVLLIMKKAKIEQTKLLLVSTARMTVQLVLAGLILTYIFEKPHPLFVIIYLAVMILFSVHRVLSNHKELNKGFKMSIALALGFSGIFVLGYFVVVVVGEHFFNPQYTIPLAGMILGNAMTGVALGLKTFEESLKSQRNRIEALLNLGVTPKEILLPFVNNALETALLPTLHRMVGMGIISLPGMMTGQILSGTPPTTAILYQIAIMVAITVAVCLTVFSALNFGYKTLYNKRNQMIF